MELKTIKIYSYCESFFHCFYASPGTGSCQFEYASNGLILGINYIRIRIGTGLALLMFHVGKMFHVCYSTSTPTICNGEKI